MVVAAFVLRLLSEEIRATRLNWLALTIMGAGLGHLFLGQVGWMERYEHYALASLGIGVLILAAHAGISAMAERTIPLIALAAGGWYYVQETLFEYHWGSRAIYNQQAQMSRFAKDYLDRNVAVNDLGWVAWRNPNYVLDLFGLSNHEARNLRIYDNTQGWGGPLVAKHDVDVIMIYHEMVGESVAEDWVNLGKLVMRNPRGFLGAAEVQFYAADAARVAHAQQAIADWYPTLPADTCWVPVETGKCAP